jgi:hypothetical protein
MGGSMARSRLINPTNDVINDDGAILWSFVKGEQLEYPVTINFITNASAGYSYEAVVIEADNISQQSEAPVTVKPAGIQTTLPIRVPGLVGTWSSSSAYTQGEVVLYNGKYYELSTGIARINATTPDLDPLWSETTLNKVYIQFPSTLASTWGVPPAVNSPVYGFFELRITEPVNPVFRKTWKPIRGMVEILFSPTDVVADV